MCTGQERLISNAKVGSQFSAKPVSCVEGYGGYDKAVVVEVSGHAHYSGRAEYWLEEGDPLATGFLVN